MKTYEVLEKALALIEDESNWTDRGWAVDPGGRMCAAGACNVAEGIIDRKESRCFAVCSSPAPVALRAALPGDYEVLPDFNDHETHADVVALFQRAIRAEKAKEGSEIPLESAEVAA